MYGSVCVRLISALRYAVLISVELESLRGKCELSSAKKQPDPFPQQQQPVGVQKPGKRPLLHYLNQFER
jgi:hypothetical protein